MAVTYDKDVDYMKLMQDAEARGDYKAAARYEQQRNAKIADLDATGTNKWNATATSDYAGWLDENDYSQDLQNQMANGASKEEVRDTLEKRIDKSKNTKGLTQYTYDSIYDQAMDYILGDGGEQGFTYESAPTYSNKYEKDTDKLYDQIMNREEFSYDVMDDPLYDQMRKTYTREGQRAMQDTLGQAAARTGGYASSYAVSAANQANNYYMSQLADRVPELYQLAYDMYKDEGDQQRLNLEMIQALEQGDYNKFLDLRAQYNADRDFAYNQHRDTVGDKRYENEWDYTVGRDQVSDSRYEDETAYDRATYEDERNYDRAYKKAQTLAAVGDFSGYKELGYSDEEIARLKAAWDRENGIYAGGSGGYRTTGGTKDNTEDNTKTLTGSDGKDMGPGVDPAGDSTGTATSVNVKNWGTTTRKEAEAMVAQGLATKIVYTDGSVEYVRKGPDPSGNSYAR